MKNKYIKYFIEKIEKKHPDLETKIRIVEYYYKYRGEKSVNKIIEKIKEMMDISKSSFYNYKKLYDDDKLTKERKGKK